MPNDANVIVVTKFRCTKINVSVGLTNKNKVGQISFKSLTKRVIVN